MEGLKGWLVFAFFCHSLHFPSNTSEVELHPDRTSMHFSHQVLFFFPFPVVNERSAHFTLFL